MPDFSRIITSVPVNAQAARQMGKGEHFTAKKTFSNAFKDPPNMRPVPNNVNDFTGAILGRVKVIGLKEKTSGGRRVMWVCRCVCGMYYIQSRKFIETGRPNGDPHMCESCDYTQYLRGGAVKR